MTRATRMFRFARTTTMCAACVSAVAVVTPPALADDPRVDVSLRVPLGDHGSIRIGYREGYNDHTYDDRHRRRPSWSERLHENFYLLTEGRDGARRARHGFGRLAELRPRAPLPKIGIALASLRLGREHDAIRAIRRAVRLDPTSLYRVPDDNSLHDIVHRMSQRVPRNAGHGYSNADEWFLLASLRVISGHEQAAREAIRYALDAGDDYYSTHALARALGVRIHEYEYEDECIYDSSWHHRDHAKHADRSRYSRYSRRGHSQPRRQRYRHHNRRRH